MSKAPLKPSLKQHTLDPKAATFVAADSIASPTPLGKAATTRGWRSAEDSGEDLRKGQEVKATEEVLEGPSDKQVTWASEERIEEIDEEASSGNILEVPSSES